MTVQGMIDKVDELKPNAITNTTKFSWIAELIAEIKTEVWETHIGEPDEKEDPLYHIWKIIDDADETLTLSSELKVPDAYVKLFEYYLYAKIDLANADYDRYNNSVILFNDAYSKYKRFYHRAHMPKGNINGFNKPRQNK